MRRNLVELSNQLEDVKDNLEGVSAVLEDKHCMDCGQ